ncbi:TetR/AcrR family transcriptional regulator C-terminal domain-containing protein [Arthrobacter pigmenti]
MRSVAAAAGSGTASLYRYFKSHHELLEVMIDTVSAEYELGQASGSPLVELTELAVQGRAIMHRHPWLPELLLTRPSMGPNSLKYLEYALSTLSNTGISEAAKLRTIAMLTAITASHALNELGSAGTSTADDAATGKYLATIIDSDQYPHLSRALGHAAPAKGPDVIFREAIHQYLTGAGLETGPH